MHIMDSMGFISFFNRICRGIVLDLLVMLKLYDLFYVNRSSGVSNSQRC